MNNRLKSAIYRFRIVSILEGISYLLFAITMPLKYLMDIITPNKVVGMAHGILFILYLFMAIENIIVYKINAKHSFLILIASLIPGATFWVEKKILKPIEVNC